MIQVEIHRAKKDFDSQVSNEEKDSKLPNQYSDSIFKEQNHAVDLIPDNDTEQLYLFQKEKDEYNPEVNYIKSAKTFTKDVLQDKIKSDTNFENISYVDSQSDATGEKTFLFIESEVGDQSFNILQDTASINTFENSLKNPNIESQTLIEKDLEIHPTPSSLLLSENDGEKKRKKKKEEIKAKLHEVKSKLAKEQEMSKHLRNQVQNEVNEREKLEEKFEHIQKELSLLHKDYSEQQQQYAECLRTMKEVQDAYVEIKTVTIENYKQEVLELQQRLQTAEGNEKVIEGLRQDALNSHLLLERLKQAHKKDVERLEDELEKQKVVFQNETEEFKMYKQESNNEKVILHSNIALLKEEIKETNSILEKTKSTLDRKLSKVKTLKSETSELNSEITNLHNTLSDKVELIADLRNQLLKEAEFLTLERDLRLKREKELEQLPILLQEKHKFEDEIDQWKHQYEMKKLKIKFLKKEIKELNEQKEKAESIMFLLPEMQKKIDLLDEEKRQLEKNIEDHIYKEKEKIAQIAFEKQEKEEYARKKKEEWESKMLGIGVCTHEKDLSESAPLSNSFNRPRSAPLLKPRPPSSSSSKYRWSNNGHRKPKNVQTLNTFQTCNEGSHTKEKSLQRVFENRYLTPKYNNYLNDSLQSYKHLMTPKAHRVVKEQKSITPRILVLGNNEEGMGKRLLAVGDRVLTKLKCNCSSHSGTYEEHTGTVMFIGFVDGNDVDVYVGLRMDDEVGHTDGKVGGKRYFYCEPRRGRFVRLDDVQKFNDMQYTWPSSFNSS